MDFGDFGRRQATEDIENATQFRLRTFCTMSLPNPVNSREMELCVNRAPTQPSRNNFGDSRRDVEDAYLSSATRWPDGEQERTDARLAQAVADIKSSVSSANKNLKSSSVRLCAKRSSPSTSAASAAFCFCSPRIFCSMLSRVTSR